jgi:hypothetical protein
MEYFSALDNNGRSSGAASKFFQLCTRPKPQNLQSRVALRVYKCNNIDKRRPPEIPSKSELFGSFRFFMLVMKFTQSLFTTAAANLPR